MIHEYLPTSTKIAPLLVNIPYVYGNDCFFPRSPIVGIVSTYEAFLKMVVPKMDGLSWKILLK